VIARLRGRYDILSLDLRGHGGSTRGPHGTLAYRDFTPAEWSRAEHDLEAAARWLADRGIADSDCVYVGSSIGSSLVARFAGDHPDTAGVVLLSPGLAYRDLAIAGAVARYPNPLLLVGSEEEGMPDTLAQLARLAGQRAIVLQVPGDAHGIGTLLDDRAHLAAVLAFIAAILPR
jgi:pimeloyl-ACP methyl ester carboxylesterase